MMRQEFTNGIEKKYQYPQISVIVTAYNRTEFLSEAMRSLEEQTIDKKLFEVILITNFPYNYTNKIGFKFKHIVMDGAVGVYLNSGIIEASGEVICYLDDDDVFHKDKLKILSETFKRNIGYYHNNTLKFSERNDIIPIDYSFSKVSEDYQEFISTTERRVNCRKNMEFNLSSIAIRKQLLIPFLDFISSIKQGTDSLNWLIFLETQQKGCIDKRILTFYRVHSSTSQKSKEKLNSLLKWYDEMVGFYESVLNNFKTESIKKLAEKRSCMFAMRRFLASGGAIALDKSTLRVMLSNSLFPSKCTSGATTLLLRYIIFRLTSRSF